MTEFDDKRHRHRAVFRTPLFTTAVTLLGVFAGWLGSLFGDEIRSAFPFYWGPGPLSAPATIFWLSLVLFALLFFYRQRATDNAREAEQRRLEQRTSELTDLIRTLPPRGFLNQFVAAYEIARSAKFNALRADSDPVYIEKATRIVLSALVGIAKSFDGNPADRTYCANIMLFLPFDGHARKDLERVRDMVVFLDPDADIESLRGVLYLSPKMSTTTATREDEPDGDIGEFALPVPKNVKSDDGARWRLLPGAPFAAFGEPGRMSAFADTNSLVQWCEENGDFSPSVLRDIEHYFSSERGRKVASFLAITVWEDPRQAEAPDSVPNRCCQYPHEPHRFTKARGIAGTLRSLGSTIFVPTCRFDWRVVFKESRVSARRPSRN